MAAFEVKKGITVFCDVCGSEKFLDVENQDEAVMAAIEEDAYYCTYVRAICKDCIRVAFPEIYK